MRTLLGLITLSRHFAFQSDAYAGRAAWHGNAAAGPGAIGSSHRHRRERHGISGRYRSGLVRRAAAAFDKGIAALAPDKLQTAFITHLHSDHTVGYPDLIFTTWVQGRRGPLEGLRSRGRRGHDEPHHGAWQPISTSVRPARAAKHGRPDRRGSRCRSLASSSRTRTSR